MQQNEIVSELANDYASRFSSLEDSILKQVGDETLANHPHAHMLSGHVQGRFLSFISNIVKPHYVLEIGTFTGYSAICLAEGLASDGELHTIEIRKADINTAAQNFQLAGLDKRIFLHGGNALEIIPTLDRQWDLVFIDADKEGYIEYYELLVPQLSADGIIIADNVLFHGQVLGEEINGKNAKAIHAFNKHVLADVRVEQVLLTLRDGLLLIKKK